LALAVEAAVGYPDALLKRIGHPAIWLGNAIDFLERSLNRDDPFARRAKGFVLLAALLFPCAGFGLALQQALLALPLGLVPLALVASSLLAQRSLYEHVADVARALERSLGEGRAAVAKIVGRDVSGLDEAGVARAAIESLAENFSDGIVAPALWMAVGGLPGALVYKAINTADSMIGPRSARFADFGFASARLDDLVNLPAARLAAGLIAVAGGRRAGDAIRIARRDAGKHASPNAGWPEAAMAGALEARLGGPRAYGDVVVDGAWLGEGRETLAPADILRALTLYRRALAALWALLALALAGALG
jgi:adenosylcobinamide-phosphate synthase